jgi:SAM-dependent methyltransferase
MSPNMETRTPFHVVGAPAPGPHPDQVEWRRNQLPYYELKDSRHAYLYDALISLGFVDRHSKVLDFGCGDGGFLAHWLAPRVRIACGYDVDPHGVALAKEKNRALTNVAVFDEIRAIPDDFDVAFLNGVWMTLASYEACIAILTTVREHTRRGGRLVAAVTHPCFRDMPTPTRETTFQRRQYFESGKPFEVTITGSNGKVVSFVDYHWTLTDMSRQLQASGWSNLRIVEIPDRGRGIGPPATSSGDQPPVWMVLSAAN